MSRAGIVARQLAALGLVGALAQPLHAGPIAAPAPAGRIVAARYGAPTTRYDHGILGDAIEYGALVMTRADGRKLRLVLPQTRVFEDLAPRLWDVDGDGAPEVVVVETDLKLGARLAIYGLRGLIAATPFIGHTHRWLAPIGAGDLDGDGTIEIAYIDRPHLAKLLKIWRFKDGKLSLVAQLAAQRGGLANHRIGETHITGGLRNCGAGVEIITASGDWQRVMATRLRGGGLTTRPLARFSAKAMRDALACRL